MNIRDRVELRQAEPDELLAIARNRRDAGAAGDTPVRQHSKILRE